MKLLFTCVRRVLEVKQPRKCFRFFSMVFPPNKNSYYFQNGNLPVTSATMGDLLDHAAATNGDTIAFVSFEQGIAKTYSELKDEADKLASGLIARGFKRGDRIAIYSPNCYEWPLTQFAAAKAGLILVAINFASQAQELEYYLKEVGCRAIISYDKLKHLDYYNVLTQVIPDLSTTDSSTVKSEKLPCLESIIMISDENKNGTIRFKDVKDFGNKDSNEVVAKTQKLVQFDDPASIQFTSGTTGKPKAAVLSHHGLINTSANIFQRLFPNYTRPNICCQVPLFHVFGSFTLLGTVIKKSTCVLPCAGFNSEKSLDAIEKYRCNTIFGSPTMHIDLVKTFKQRQIDKRPVSISCVRTVLFGAAPPPESSLKEIQEVFNDPNIINGYGSTEALGIACHGPGLDIDTVIQNYLQPLNNIEIKIVDSEGQIIPKNTTGEICLRGYSILSGYWNNEEKTKEAIDKNRWFHSGDLGVMNEDGCIKLVGRIKDMVIRGGENIYTAEVESFLSLHPSVLEVSICGVPDERLGEELCCWISIKPNKTLTEEEIRNYCKGKISHFKIPRYIMFVEEFPKTTTGKVKKHEIAKISISKLNL